MIDLTTLSFDMLHKRSKNGIQSERVLNVMAEYQFNMAIPLYAGGRLA